MPASVTADPAEARAPEPADRGRLRWWKEVLFGAAVYAIYSAVRNQFGSAGGDPGPAFEHARQIIRLEEAIGLYVEPSIQSWYLDLPADRSEEHTSELQSLMRISYAVFCLKKKKK